MAGIFVSYRRRDRPIATRFLVAKLDQHYGAEQVFHDLADIDPGEHFLDGIKRALDKCTVLIAVIGPDWLEAYRERLHREDDPVRLEIGTALRKDVLVLPVLLGSAGMPSPQDLPDDLVELHYKNAVPLRSTDFDADINRLINRLDRMPCLAEVVARAGLEAESSTIGPKKESSTTGPKEKPSTTGPGAGPSTPGPETEPPAPGAANGDPTRSITQWSQPRPVVTCTLTDAASGSRIELSGEDIVLNRGLLDPDNTTLSSRSHARLACRNGQWSIVNLSSNGATFAQIGGEHPLEDQDRVLLGSAVFRFESDAGAPPHGGRAETVTLDQLQPYRRKRSTGTGFRLVAPDGESHSFTDIDVLLTRDSLAPGNTSISRSGHARVLWRDGCWSICDLSSNSATFVQANKPLPLAEGGAVVLGDRLYTFHSQG